MKILVVKISSLGDVVHTLPAVNDLLNHFPAAKVDWLVEEAFCAIPSWNSGINKIIPIALRSFKKNPLKYFSSLIATFKVLRSTKYQYIIDAQGLLKSAVLARIARGTVYGYTKACARESVASYCYHHQIMVAREHAIVKTRKLFAKIFGYSVVQEIHYGIDYKFPIKNNNKYIMFVHGTTWKSKEWPLRQWQELAKCFAAANYKICVTFLGAREEQRINELRQGLDNIEIVHTPTINHAAGLIKNAQLVIAVDTGFAHIAAAFKVPLIMLFGATNPDLVASNSVVLREDMSCSPCNARSCKLQAGDALCMQQLTAQKVFSQAQLMLE